jgi:hypothetical protein
MSESRRACSSPSRRPEYKAVARSARSRPAALRLARGLPLPSRFGHVARAPLAVRAGSWVNHNLAPGCTAEENAQGHHRVADSRRIGPGGKHSIDDCFQVELADLRASPLPGRLESEGASTLEYERTALGSYLPPERLRMLPSHGSASHAAHASVRVIREGARIVRFRANEADLRSPMAGDSVFGEAVLRRKDGVVGTIKYRAMNGSISGLPVLVSITHEISTFQARE